MTDFSGGSLIVALLVFLIGATLMIVALWQRRGLPQSREERLEDEVKRLRAEVDKLRATVQTLTDAWTADREKLNLLTAQNRDLQEQVAALTGKAGSGQVAPKTLTALRKALTERLRLEELVTLAANIEVDMEELGGESQEGKALRLIQHLQDRGRVGVLVYELRRLRPDIKLEVGP